jgi:hypothetical protein
MYQLAIRGYRVQLTDSRFPTEDMLVVSPKGKHFGIDVKGQRTPNFWQFNCKKKPHDELFYAFVFVPPNAQARVCLIDSATTAERWKQYKYKCLGRGVKDDNIWGPNWKTPFDHEDKWEVLPE